MHLTLQKFEESARHLFDGVLARLPSVILAIVVFVIFYSLSGLVARTIQRTTRGRRENLGLVFGRVLGWATVLLGLLVAVSIIAPSFQAADLIKVLGIGGVAIGFAFQNILQNFLAGLLLLWAEPFRVGDEIKLDAFEGKVEEIQTRATIIRTFDERRVVIPNADLFTHSVIVNTALNERRWQYDLEIERTGGTKNPDELKRAIVSAIQKVPGVIAEPGPEALLTDIAPDAIKMRILWATREARQHQMLASYDRVLTAIYAVVEKSSDGAKQRPAA